jgi:hypothetical protein
VLCFVLGGLTIPTIPFDAQLYSRTIFYYPMIHLLFIFIIFWFHSLFGSSSAAGCCLCYNNSTSRVVSLLAS